MVLVQQLFSEMRHASHLSSRAILVPREPGPVGRWMSKLDKCGSSTGAEDARENGNGASPGLSQKSWTEYSFMEAYHDVISNMEQVQPDWLNQGQPKPLKGSV